MWECVCLATWSDKEVGALGTTVAAIVSALTWGIPRLMRARGDIDLAAGELAERRAARESAEDNALIDKLTKRIDALEADLRAAERRTDKVRDDARDRSVEYQKESDARIRSCEQQRGEQAVTIAQLTVDNEWYRSLLKEHGWISDEDDRTRTKTPGAGIMKPAPPKTPPEGT